MHMKITVFGATGGIGGHVVRQALDAGHHVTAVDPNSRYATRHSRSSACPASPNPGP